MTKSNMVMSLMVKHGMSKEDATAVVETLLGDMQDALLRGEDVVLMNIGTLHPSRQTKTQRVSFGKVIDIKREVKVSFRPSKNLEIKPKPVEPEKANTGGVIDMLKKL